MARVLLLLALTVLLACYAEAKIKKCCTTGDCSNAKKGKYKKPKSCAKIETPTGSAPFCKQPSISSSDCCQWCKNATGVTCEYWLWVPNGGKTCGGKNCGNCFHYPYYRHSGKEGEHGDDHNEPDEDDKSGIPNSLVGRNCEHTKDDPHFLGAQGTHFDFNGQPDKSFCLYTDKNVHVNMKMTGYLDTRTTGATIVQDGKALRTWIRELAVMWRDGAGERHSLVMTARAGKQQGRGSGFLKSAVLDGVTLAPMRAGEKRYLAGGLELAFSGMTHLGHFEMDSYVIKVGEQLEMQADLRVANPLLQTATDAMTHINVMFLDAESTVDVHGVMGQTFRLDRNKRARDYIAISHLLHRPVSADGATGRGFLDGKTADYETSDVTATDCAYSSFNGAALPDTQYHPVQF